MASDLHTQLGVFNMQKRIIELTKRLAGEKGVELHTYHALTFFDGSMKLPERDAPWNVTIRSHRRNKTIVLSAFDLEAFDAGRLSMVSNTIGMALNELSSA